MSRERGDGTGAGSVRDPAAQPERTRLAWRRTALAFAVVVVLALRQAVHGTGVSPAYVAPVVLAWPVLLVVAHRRARVLTAPRPEPLGVSEALAVVVCTLTVAICGVVALW